MNITKMYDERLLCKTEDYLLCYKNGYIRIKNADGTNVIKEYRIHSYFKSIRLFERLLRYEPRVGIALDRKSFLFTDHGKIYYCSNENDCLRVEHSFDKGMNNPLSFCARYDEDGKIIDLLYGEYIWNTNRGPVSVYRRENDIWKKLFTFPDKTIQHIHGITYDKYRGRYLILTGDKDSESGIWEADIDFKKVEPLVRGSQKYRACLVFPTKEKIYYITDTPLEQNYVFSLDRDGIVHKVAPIPGPCIYGIIKSNALYFATSVEGNPNLGKWRYMLSNKLGPGVSDRYSHILKVSEYGAVEEIGKIKKDILPMWLFEFGNVKFPQSDDDKVYICPQSLRCKYGTYLINEQ